MRFKCYLVTTALCFVIVSATDEAVPIHPGSEPELAEICPATGAEVFTTLAPTCAIKDTPFEEPEIPIEEIIPIVPPQVEETQCETPPLLNHTLPPKTDVIERQCPSDLYDCTENPCPEGLQICEPGYYRHPSIGQCVLLQDCPDICNENEILTRLVYPSNEIPKGQPAFKCICRDGYERDKTGKCVPRKPPCGPNSKRVECGTACPITCRNYLLPRQPCALACIPDSCVCYDGFVMNDLGQCVAPSECPGGATCPVNSEWRMCVNPNPITCDMLTKKQIPDCSKACPSAFTCQCKMGYVHRSSTDLACVPVDQCFTKKVAYKPVVYSGTGPNPAGVQVVPRVMSYNPPLQQKPVEDVNGGPVTFPPTE